MHNPWKCPDCKTWMRGDVTEHRCDPPQYGAVTVTPRPNPSPGSGWTYPLYQCAHCFGYHTGYHACWTVNPGQVWTTPTNTTGGGLTVGTVELGSPGNDLSANSVSWTQFRDAS
jgi:hypothetical protein